MPTVYRVIVGASGSPASLQALRYAQHLARDYDATLVPVLAWLPPCGDLADRRTPNEELRRLWAQDAGQRLQDALHLAWGTPPTDLPVQPLVPAWPPRPGSGRRRLPPRRPAGGRGRPPRRPRLGRRRPGEPLLPRPRPVPGPGPAPAPARLRNTPRRARPGVPAPHPHHCPDLSRQAPSSRLADPAGSHRHRPIHRPHRTGSSPRTSEYTDHPCIKRSALDTSRSDAAIRSLSVIA